MTRKVNKQVPFSKELLQRIKQEARNKDISENAVIRLAVSEKLNKQDGMKKTGQSVEAVPSNES